MSQSESQLNKDEIDKYEVKKEDLTDRQDLMKLLEESNFEIHSGNNQHDGYHEKVQKEDFVNKISEAQKKSAIYNIVKGLTWEEKYEFINMKKLKGNRLFKKANYKEAIDIYLESFVGLEINSGDKQKDLRMRDELQIPVLLNIAQCLMKLEQFNKAVTVCSKAVELNENSMKAYCKRGLANAGTLNFDQSEKDFLKAISLTDNSQDKKDIQSLYNKMKYAKNNQIKKYKNMFSEGQYLERKNNKKQNVNSIQENDLNSNNKKVLVYNDDLEDLSRYKILKYPIYHVLKGYSFFKNIFGCKRKNQFQEIQGDQESSEEDSD